MQYVMERMLEAFKTNFTPAQAMTLFAKDSKRTWPDHDMYLVASSDASGGGVDYLVLNNIVPYASADLRTVLLAKMDNTQGDTCSRPRSWRTSRKPGSWSRPDTRTSGEKL